MTTYEIARMPVDSGPLHQRCRLMSAGACPTNSRSKMRVCSSLLCQCSLMASSQATQYSERSSSSLHRTQERNQYTFHPSRSSQVGGVVCFFNFIQRGTSWKRLRTTLFLLPRDSATQHQFKRSPTLLEPAAAAGFPHGVSIFFCFMFFDDSGGFLQVFGLIPIVGDKINFSSDGR
jgi:hypothetical protein